MALEVSPVVEVDVPHLPGRERAQALGDAVEEARRLAEEHGRLYVVDRRGLRLNKSDVEFVKRVSSAGEVWVDAGPRYAQDVMDLLIAGANEVVVRWHTLDRWDELEESTDMSEFLHVGVEMQGRSFLRNPRHEDVDITQLMRRSSRLDLGLVMVGHPGEDGRTHVGNAARQADRFRGPKRYLGRLGDGDRRELEAAGFDGAFVSARELHEGGIEYVGA